MPYALGHETGLLRPTKRRRLLTDMDKAARDDKESPQSNDPEEQHVVTDCTESSRDSMTESGIHHEIRTSNREELIECIKRGQKPTWVPKPNLQALCAEEESLQEANSLENGQGRRTWQPQLEWSPLQLTENDVYQESWKSTGLPVWHSPQQPSPRPRSAFHTGDFRSDRTFRSTASGSPDDDPFMNIPMPVQSSTPPPWLTNRHPTNSRTSLSGATGSREPPMAGVSRQRAPSLGSSFSSCFILRTPTSPLVHAITSSSHDLATAASLPSSTADRQSRRRTMPPNSFNSLHMSPVDSPMTFSDGTSPRHVLRRESTMPEQLHRPRRSLNSFTLQSSLDLQSRQPRPRRQSIASDPLSRRRTSMVGSFEESILRGRMSSPASKPFDFRAQIGVMGRGDCPSSLKCPAHVSVSFHAVFYSYPTSSIARTIADDAPSPYVGTIDLTHGLKSIQLGTKRRSQPSAEIDLPFHDTDPVAPENTPIGKALARDLQKQEQNSSLARMNIGGAYRVPQKGQLQIIIKNPNKTAVKLFLVPYDLSGMDAGTKTFVRQKSYTSGPILEGAIGKTSYDTAIFDPLKDKSILRYLIHLNFCCPSKNRFYLHGDIRVVFANRVPDGKEKLRNEIQVPEPRYTPYRPAKTPRESSRRSGVDLSPSSGQFGSPQGLLDGYSSIGGSLTPSIPEERSKFAGTIPFHLATHNDGRPSQESAFTDVALGFADLPPKPTTSPRLERALSPVQGFLPSTSARSSPIPWGSSTTSSTSRSFSPAPVEAGSGLLSRQFKNLNGHADNPEPDLYKQSDHTQRR